MSEFDAITVPPKRPWAYVWHYVRLYPRWYWAIAALQIGAAMTATLMPYAIGRITGAVSDGLWDHADLWQASLPALGLLFGLAVAQMLCARGATLCMIMVRPQQKIRIVRDLFAYLQRHSARYFGEHFAGSLAHRIGEGSIGLLEITWNLIVDMLPILVVLITSLVLLTLASPWLGLGLLVWVLAYTLLAFVLSRKAQVLAADHAKARSVTTGKIVDAVSNLASIRLFARQDFELDYLNRYQTQEKQAAQRSFFYQEKIRLLQDSLSIVLRVGLVAVALYLWHLGKIDVGQLVMVATLGLMIVAQCSYLSMQFMQFFESIGNIQNSIDTLLKPHEMPDRTDALPARIEKGTIRFRDVNFGYSPDKPIFKHFNLNIAAGQRVGIVGLSGSGKSTLLNLLLRAYDPQKGQVEVDGVDIQGMTQQSLHSHIGLIPQEPGLFHRSLRENIGYGDVDADESAIVLAAKRAHAHDFILHMQDGYDALIGERGVKLSGGQRQRIAIARALLKNAPILVLDEATASLDSETESLIQSSLDDIMADKTVLVVAHRLSTIAHLDRIVVLDKGLIVEDGSHQHLLELKGLYYRLWQHQSDGLLSEKDAREDELLVT
ncbi:MULTISPECIES: ABC transporter ATP-binding protein [unclassified Pseudomonas]|uniref:ABC transporter ATP-binding protein n=1 Tax=unclassified Pseudomonas TaxID=196821 RepID=UPI001297C276|nr:MULTISPECIES: ABC transporter ATP-binding protein [unclassified Pseudomonas]MQT42206.1 ATP-binding cassette domain-containing protein [Pseudomonas sp. FSL R10-0765]MQT50874.1 ATP-binding cassette domain-containing protein [Pseudomonas sp. FSL R10-2398]MQU03163.1 ATP-binding cassette domain-containing protein [Pseudomonas sp. FSL R10-2245]MQU10570.1 ATP-binding cassette domain-containing protein [Pseudomonas sp. FSL R10-2189]MQU35901.1 ATP-binding cassette domain-containing protein [Pseudomo